MSNAENTKSDAENTKPAPRFLGDRPRFKTYKLEWPLEYAGKIYEEIHLVRLSSGEVEAFIEKLTGSGEAKVAWPIFRDAEGALVPDGLMDALDADDRDALGKAQLDFLPRRFLGAATSDSPPAAGATTA